jgi:hypothetical protein
LGLLERQIDPAPPPASPTAPAPTRTRWPWDLLGAAGLAAALLLAAVLIVKRAPWPFGPPYPRLEHDHAELMVARPAKAGRTLTVLFVGNSFTYRNDLPAMLVNLASSDPGNATGLQVQAVTYPDAWLDDLRTRTHALDWARDHHPDYVVLQEHSFWYDGGYPAARAAVGRWIDALRPLRAAPLLFEAWTDAAGSDAFRRGSSPADDARNDADGANTLGRSLGVPVVAVGQAFEAARRTPGEPNLYGPDRHHPSVAGTYFAALVFYRFFTGRTGAEATWRPRGLSPQDAAMLVRLNGG